MTTIKMAVQQTTSLVTRSFSFIFVHPLDPEEGLSSKPKYRANCFEIYIFLFYYFIYSFVAFSPSGFWL